jgi:mono/diheme cytochrome c family protein
MVMRASLPRCRLPLVAALLAIPWMVACHTDMYDQPKFRPLEETEFFKDGNSSRPIPADTVARGHLLLDTPLNTGMQNGKPVEEIPVPVTAPLLQRGREQFNIFCSPCHGRTGDGRGMIVERGFKPPPSYHIDRLRQAPAGHFFDVITNGFGGMYDYRERIAPEDRWAIVAYIRALQLAQHAPLIDAPPDEVRRLEAEPR